MSSIPTLAGITSRMIRTERINQHVLSSGDPSGTPVVFVHGNCSSATYWEETMLALPTGYHAIAPDQRGYGDTEPLPIDATQGLDDMADDILALLKGLEIGRYHLVGHSMGGNVAMKMALKDAANIRTITLVAPGSPYGYGGSKGVNGELTYPDGAPGGGGGANPDFVRLIADKERGGDNQMAPRNVMNAFYFKPPFTAAREEALLSSLLSTRTGENHYPGNFVASENWPGVAPGDKGILNALSCYHYNASALVDIDPKPPILWVRGSHDQIVADLAMFEVAALGSIGAIPGHPGNDICPPQPMITQTRQVLDQYTDNGGTYNEIVIKDTGHTPYIENPTEFNTHLHTHIV